MRNAAFTTVILALALTCHAEEYRAAGRVVDDLGKPVRHAMVSAFWRANGSPRTSDGKPYDLTDPEQNAAFWGNVGDMQPWQTPVETAADGSFAITLPGRKRHLLAMDASRALGGIAEISKQASAEKLEIRLRPLVTVSGQMKSVVPGKPVDWSHVYVELAADPTNPLAMRRVVSCGSYDGRFSFRLPPGTYRLDAYGNSDRDLQYMDLRVTSSPSLTIDGTRPEIDIGTLELELARPGRHVLEKSAKESGRWRDYTKQYGEPAPRWHAVDARGISKQTTIEDFRGKWLMINFWGLGCPSCLSRGIPEMMEFCDTHADKKDRFEVIGVCIDIHGQLPDLKALDAALAPIVTHVWNGRRIDFPIVLDSTFQTWERYGIPGLGTVVLVDPQGNLFEGDGSTLHRILTGVTESADARPPAPRQASNEGFRPVRVIDARDGTLQCTQFSPDGKSVAACGDQFVQMFDVTSGERVQRFKGHTGDIFRFAFSPNGQFVASGSRDTTVHVWDVQTGKVLTVLDAHTDRIIGVNFSADSRWLASASANHDGTIRVWDCSTWRECARTRAPENTNAMYLAFSPDGESLATSEYRGGVRLYAFDGQSLRLRHEMTHDGGEMTPHVTFAPRGDAFLTSSWDKTIRLWDVHSGRQIWKRAAPPYARCFEASVYSPDGSTIYSVTRDETIQARDAKTGKLKKTRRWNDTVRGLAINPDGSLLATSGNRGEIKLWSVDQFQ